MMSTCSTVGSDRSLVTLRPSGWTTSLLAACRMTTEPCSERGGGGLKGGGPIPSPGGGLQRVRQLRNSTNLSEALREFVVVYAELGEEQLVLEASLGALQARSKQPQVSALSRQH